MLVELTKDEVTSFGFNVKGGSEFGTPVIVWRVEDRSLAQAKGLRTGLQILSANNVDFNNISHADALNILRTSSTLKLNLAQPPPPSKEMLKDSPYTWIDRHGNHVAPPTNSPSNNSSRIINLDINPGQNLGLMIRGGFEYGLGIYVTGVDKGSVAARVGLQRGDEILEVNGYNFQSITHDKAVQILKSSRKMTILASQVGKIPSDLNNKEDLIDLKQNLVTTNMSSFDEFDLVDQFDDKDFQLDFTTPLYDEERKEEDLLLLSEEKTASIDQMIEEKARTVLTKSEHSRFTFYRLEYVQGFLPLQTFMRILLELLNTAEKYTLLTEVREIIRKPQDLQTFDELIYAKTSPSGRRANTSNQYDQPQRYDQPEQQVVPSSSCVRYKVRVGKTKPILGIAIEGGSNTQHRLPRVIDVNTEGSAYGSSLKPGQVLLSVDGKGLDGFTHEDIARTILDSYMDISKNQIEFVVVETKSSFLLNQQQIICQLTGPG